MPEQQEPEDAGCDDDTVRPWATYSDLTSPPDDVEPAYEEVEVPADE